MLHIFHLSAPDFREASFVGVEQALVLDPVRVATFTAPAITDAKAHALEQAYTATQSIERHWADVPSTRLTVKETRARSTSVGDLMFCDTSDRLWRVCRLGFGEVTRPDVVSRLHGLVKPLKRAA